MIVFGPVPSRRLGRSLGVNNLPDKRCSYSCAYCQIGRTPRRQIERTEVFDPDRVVQEVEAHVDKLRNLGEPIDFITFVPNGEPTLDLNLGAEIRALRRLGIKIGVITNSSLLWREDVRADLSEADWVSVKVDAVSEKLWRKVDRPHPALKISALMEGLLRFAADFHGEVVTETMLVRGVNDNAEVMREIADLLSKIHPRRCYLAMPIRTPAEAWVLPPTSKVLSECAELLAERAPDVEILPSDEEEPFTLTGTVDEDILNITAVHPMERKDVDLFLQKAGAEWSVIERLLENGGLVRTEFEGKQFYRKSVE